MSDKTLIIHIGAHKTGSTTIQEAFGSGGVSLKGASYLYPARLDHNYLRADFMCHQTGLPLPKRGPMLLGFEALANKIRQTSSRYVVLSGEYFENLEPEVMQDVLHKYFRQHVTQVKVIAYLRPHIPRFVSGFAEAIKIGWFQGDMSAFFKAHREYLLYAPRFQRWKQVFGAEFHLRAVHKEHLVNGSVLDDFINVAFDTREFKARFDGPKNKSLSVQDIVLLKFFQERFQHRKGWLRHSFGWELARQLRLTQIGSEKNERLEIYQGLAQQIANFCKYDAHRVDEQFFSGAPVFEKALLNGRNVERRTPQSLEPEAYFSPVEIRNMSALRELILDAMRTKHDWASHFHGFRVKDVTSQLSDNIGWAHDW